MILPRTDGAQTRRAEKARPSLRLVLVAIALVLAASVGRAQSTTLTVPTDHATIQGAIDSAAAGDTVVVYPGEWFEHDIDFRGKAITVRSLLGSEHTRVNAQGLGRCVRFASGEGPASVLEGFEFVGGVGAFTIPHPGGAGIVITNSAPTIVGCRFTGMSTLGSGDGIVSIHGNATLHDCSFTTQGAALAIYGNVTMTGCTLDGCVDGIYLDSGQCTLEDCALVGNSGTTLFIAGGNVTMERCSIVGNTSAAGSPILGFAGNFSASNSVFSHNSSVASGGFPGWGGAIWTAGINVTLTNCTLFGNSAVAGGAVAAASSVAPSVVFRNSVFWGNVPDDFASPQVGSPPVVPTVSFCSLQTMRPGPGNFVGDPMLADPAGGDHHLTLSSPCIHAGDPDATGLALFDIDGDPRVDGPAVDIGADEFFIQPALYPGTGEDLYLATTVPGGGPTVALDPVKSAQAGDLLGIRFWSPASTFDGRPPLLLGQVFPTGTTPVSVFPGIAFDLSLAQAPVVLFDGTASGGPFGEFLLPPGGIALSAIVPVSMLGSSVLLQAFVFDTLAANSIFASTDGHEIQVSNTVTIPTPTAVVPAQGWTLGGETVIIIGDNLDHATGVTVGGAPATIIGQTATSLTITTPPGAPGTTQIDVVGVAGTASIGFEYIAHPPTITGVGPVAAAAGTVVSITGTYFHPGLALTVGGAVVVPDSIGLTQVDFTAPSGVPCDSTLVVTNPDGQSATAAFNPQPSVTSVSPDQGSTVGGDAVTFTGQNLHLVSAVTFGGSQAQVTASSENSLTVITPPGAAGPVPVVLTSPGGCTAGASFDYVVLTPVIATIAPTSAAPGEMVTLTGNYFAAGVQLQVGGIAIAPASVSPSQITFTNPLAVPCDTTVIAMNPDGQSASIGFNPSPTITALSPPSGSVLGGTVVTVSGTNLDLASMLSVGGIPVAISSQTATSLTFTTPAVAAEGLEPVVVTTPGSCSASALFSFYFPAPVISSVSPLQPMPGQTVTVSGANFQPGIFASVGTVGGVQVVPTSVTPTSFTFVCPAGIPTDTVLFVGNPNGLTDTFPFNPCFTVSGVSFDPATGYIQINGSLFTPGMSVTVNGVPAVVVVETPTEVYVQNPHPTFGTFQYTLTSVQGCTVTLIL